MKIFVRFFFALLLTSCVLFCFSYFVWYSPESKPANHDTYKSNFKKSSEEFNKLKSRAESLKEFAHAHSYNKELFFLVDMSITSGKYRFFVYDGEKDSVVLKGLAAHGSCDRGFQQDPTFSNTKESGCSSLGKYKIGTSYKGKFGLAYKLYGLDSSNSNAFERNIVLHAYDCVPEKEADPQPICNSRGCPMVSPGILKQLKPIIDNSTRPILLWIFE